MAVSIKFLQMVRWRLLDLTQSKMGMVRPRHLRNLRVLVDDRFCNGHSMQTQLHLQATLMSIWVFHSQVLVNRLDQHHPSNERQHPDSDLAIGLHVPAFHHASVRLLRLSVILQGLMRRM